jgi:hypothetical protein
MSRAYSISFIIDSLAFSKELKPSGSGEGYFGVLIGVTENNPDYYVG